MNQHIRSTLVALALSGTTACVTPLSVNDRQAATMSPQAVAAVKKLKDIRLPIINPSDKMLFKVRAQLAAEQNKQFDEMMTRLHPSIEYTQLEGVKVVVVTPRTIKEENRGKAMLYIHGGGYIMGSAADRTGLLMADELGIKTYSIDYQLAPEAQFPVALNECLAVYRQLVSTYGPDNIVGVSISAGSGHMVAMLLKAREMNLPMIKAIALLSPSLDLTARGDSVTANDGRDILAYDNQADKLFVAPFIGAARVDNPLVSPIYGTYHADFPATVIVTGTRDTLLSGAVRMYWKLHTTQVPVELSVSEGMWHGFMNFPDVPEAIAARKSAQDFLLGHLHEASAAKHEPSNRVSTRE